MYGYSGKILRINLSENLVEVQSLEENIYRKFLGGTGLAAKILFEDKIFNVDPLDPANELVFSIGPFQGTGILGSSRVNISAKSPLTGIWGESTAGGSFGHTLKLAGFDAIVIQGKAEKPVYLWVHEGEAEIRDASKFWGMDSYEAHDRIKEEVEEPKASIATIGQAGENLVRMACIVIDKHAFAGRTGMGAVMGSKKLKAIAVYGTTRPEIADPEGLREFSRDLSAKIIKVSKDFSEHGTPYFLPLSYDYRNVPLKNWAQGNWTRGICKISPPRYTERILVKRIACPYCPIGCHRYVKVEKPEKYACEGAGPEYETISMMGTNLLIDDLEGLAKLNDLSNRYGVDTISTGSAIAVVMECYEKGILTKEDMDGLELKWGDVDAAIELLKKIAKREGIGDLLANGALAAAKKIGKEAVSIVQQVKGLDFPAHDPRACNAMALNYATGNRGACHMRGFVLDHYQVYMAPGISSLTMPEIGIGLPPKTGWKGHGIIVARNQDWACLFDSLIQCKFMTCLGKDNSLRLGDQVKLLNYITAWKISAREFIKIGERIFNLQRMFNVMAGISRIDDKMPPRVFEKAHPYKHSIPIFEPMLDEYYEVRGWTIDGKPSKEKLLELGLEEEAKALYKE
ncbi:aldehyde ferredoxin oxidoreductase family protein [Candidatus Bathyarchaeota archaeon]|nr:aldehyde ferredoxin oxidoreductase family protein [Candidatus Bathyarchaeota archaeon]